MVVVIDSSVPRRVARLQSVWRKCMTTTIRPVSTMILIGLSETNTIGYHTRRCVSRRGAGERKLQGPQNTVGFTPHIGKGNHVEGCSKAVTRCSSALTGQALGRWRRIRSLYCLTWAATLQRVRRTVEGWA